MNKTISKTFINIQWRDFVAGVLLLLGVVVMTEIVGSLFDHFLLFKQCAHGFGVPDYSSLAGIDFCPIDNLDIGLTTSYFGLIFGPILFFILFYHKYHDRHFLWQGHLLGYLFLIVWQWHAIYIFLVQRVSFAFRQRMGW